MEYSVTPIPMNLLRGDDLFAFADWLTRRMLRQYPEWPLSSNDNTVEIDWVREKLPDWRIERPIESFVTIGGKEHPVLAQPGQLMAIHTPVGDSPQPIIVEQVDLPPKLFVEACETSLLRFGHVPELSEQEARTRYHAGERYIEEQTRKGA